nr:hypothetical protein Q903MT_gene2963 [Picea sitchensis]
MIFTTATEERMLESTMGVTYIYSIEKTRYSDSQLPTLLTDGKPAQSGRNPPSFFLPPKRKIQ